MTPLREKILKLARTFDGQIMSANDAMMLKSTMGSMDDTLTDDEVYMFLKSQAEGEAPLMSISATPPDNRLVKVNVSAKGEVTVSAPPFSRS